MKKLSECEKGYRRWISPSNKTVPKRTKRKIKPLNIFTDAQLKLKRKHGTPSEFARACYASVPEFIGMGEAATAVEDYRREWENAAEGNP